MAIHFVLFVLSMVVFSATAYNGELNVPGIPIRNIQARLRRDEGITPDPGTTLDPEIATAPGTTPDPGTTIGSEITTAPGTTPEPGTTIGSEITTAPGSTPDPGTTLGPEITTAPGTTLEPEITPGSPEATTPTPGPHKCKSTGFSCEDSCKSPKLQYCAAEGEEPIVSVCKDKEVCVQAFGGAPTCKEKKSACSKDAKFECPESNKFYPNLANCNRFYFCNDKKETIQMICPQDYVYDPLRHNCGPRSQGLRCHTVQCSGKELQVYPYPGDRSLYAICMLGELKMAECPDPEEFSPSQSRCILTCRGRGKFPYRNDCRKFYHCQRCNAKPVPDQCAPGAIFNYSNQSCEPGECKN